MLLTRAFGNTLGHLACAAKEKATKTKMAFILSFFFQVWIHQSMFWINIWQESLTWRHSMTTTILGNNKTSCLWLTGQAFQMWGSFQVCSPKPKRKTTIQWIYSIIQLNTFYNNPFVSICTTAQTIIWFDTFQGLILFHPILFNHILTGHFKIWSPNSQCTILGGFSPATCQHEITRDHYNSPREFHRIRS